MSILIKGMEMPKSCGDCKAFVCYRQWAGDVGDCFCGITKNDAKAKEKNADCPLVPVPKHGRLIDADAFAAEMKKRQDACAAWRDDIKNGGGYGTELYYRADSFLGAMCETKLTLDKMPTIIPAEEGE